MLRICLGILCTGVLSLCPLTLSATQNLWTGAGGDHLWTNSANWSLGAPPDSSQDVLILDSAGAAVVLNAPAVIGALALGGPSTAATLSLTNGSLQCQGPALVQTNSTLNLAGDFTAASLEVDGSLNWAAGSLTVWGSALIAPAGSLSITTLSNSLSGTFCNNGTLTCLATDLIGSPGLQFTNNGLFILLTNLSLSASSGGYPDPSFYNLGTIVAPPNAGHVVLALTWDFYNQGTLQAETNSVLEVQPANFGTTIFQNGSVFDGSGLIRLAGSGNFSCNGNMQVHGTVELDGPFAFQPAGAWSGPGLFRWLSGSLDSFTFGPGFQVQMAGPADKVFFENCNNLGTMTWTEDANLIVYNTGLNNYGQIILQTNCTLGPPDTSGGQGSFNNFGTLLVPANTGKLPLVIGAGCAFQNLGTLRAETNSVLEVQPANFGTTIFQNGSVFDGSGLIRLAGSGNFSCNGNMQVNGTVELDGPFAFQPAGTWSGPGLFRWLSGSLDSFTFGPGFQVQMAGPADKVFFENCTNLGTMTWTEDAKLIVYNTGLNNYGQIILQTNCTLGPPDTSGGQGSFNNFGTLLVPANTGKLPLVIGAGCAFQNLGTLRAETNSVLEVQPANFGTTIFQNGSVFDGSGLIRLAGSGNFSCNGNMQVNSTVELDGPFAFQPAGAWSGPGLFRWLSGSLDSFTFGPGFQVQMAGPADKVFFENCTNLGTMTWTEDASLVLPSGSATNFYNYGQFILQTNCTLACLNGGSGQGYFLNFGTILAPVGSAARTLVLSNGCAFYSLGTLQADTNAALVLYPSTSGGLVLQEGSVINGAGVVRFAGSGTFGCNGRQQLNGTLELDGPFAFGLGPVWNGPGLFRWLSGSINAFTFGTNAHVEALGTEDKVLGSASTNLGCLRWLGPGPLVNPSGGSYLANGGLFTFETNSTWSPTITFINLPGGTLRQVSGDAYLRGVENFGQLELRAGTLTVGNFLPWGQGTCQWELSGTVPGTGFAPLYTGYFGMYLTSLSVTLTNGFIPTNGMAFVLATNIVANGQFTSTSLPPLASGSHWRLLQPTNDLTLKVVGAPVLTGTARLVDGSFQFTLSGEGSAVEVQTSTNLVDWITLQTNGPFSGPLTLNDTNAAQFPRRFYRARISE